MPRIVPTSDPGRPDPQPRTIHRSPDGTDVIDCHPREVAQLLASGGPLWVDIDSTVRSQHALLEKVFRFHPLAVEDTLNPASRVKLEEYDGYMFIILRGVALADSTNDPYDLETKDQLDLALIEYKKALEFDATNLLASARATDLYRTIRDLIEKSLPLPAI